MSAGDQSALQHAPHPEALLTALVRDNDLLHASYFVSAMPLSPEAESPAQPVFWTTYPLVWQMRYFSAQYWKIDPAVHVDRMSLMPVDWDTFDRSSRAVRNFFGEAEDFGVGRHGLVAPVRGPRGERAIVSVTSNAGDAEWAARRQQLMRGLIVSALEIHDAAMRHIGFYPQAEAPHLAPREAECLQWSAAGKTVEEIAIILNMSRRNVRAQLDTARSKLRANNIAHAVSRAIGVGIIAPS